MENLATRIVALLVLGTAALAQAPRGKLAGWVQDAAGKKVVGADVVLLSQLLPGRSELAGADELRVRTGDDGMFRAELLEGRAYSAWATWRDAAGVEQRTEVLEGAIPGPPRPLLAAPPQRLRTLRITGAEAWAARAPLHAMTMGSGENALVVPLRLDAELRATLPTLPGMYCDVEVHGADGSLLGGRIGARLDDAKLEELVVALPPPGDLRVTVVDEKGAPVAGASVVHTCGQGYRRDVASVLGRTDASGELRAVVPAANPLRKEKDSSFSLLVEAPGRQRTVLFGELDKLGGAAQVVLRPGSELRGRVLGRDGAPVRGLTLLPDCYAMFNDGNGGSGVTLRPAPIDAEGRFAFCSLHASFDFRLLALLEPAAARAAGLRLRDGVAVAPVLWLAVGAPPFQSPHDLGDLRLDQLPVAMVEVKTHDGVPVPGARLAVTTHDLYNSPLSYVCDRVGRLQFPLPTGEIRIGAWVPGGGVATRLVRSPAAPGDAPIDTLVLTLSATRTVRGVVVDGDGKPVAGAVVMQWNRAKCEDRQLAELTFHGRSRSEPTGADGAFALVLPMDDAPFGLRAWVKSDAAMLWSEERVTSPTDLDADHLRLVVAPLPPAPAKAK